MAINGATVHGALTSFDFPVALNVSTARNDPISLEFPMVLNGTITFNQPTAIDALHTSIVQQPSMIPEFHLFK